MKKLLLLGLAAHVTLLGVAQLRTDAKNYYKPFTKKVASDGISVPSVIKSPNNTTASANNKAAYEEAVLGITTYDLQTNGSIQNRLNMDANGNMAAVWTASEQSNTTRSDRGTGYSYFDGSGWTLSSKYPRIETVRCGWPSLLFPASGGEVVVSHQSIIVGSSTDTKVRINSRPSIGSGSWTEKLVSNTDLTWPRATMGGADGNTLHLIAVTAAEDSNKFGERRVLVYYRSNDGGSTFNIQDSVLPGLDAGSVGPIGGDSYAITSMGDIIVISVFDTWNDVFYLRSEDNGDTWTKTVVWNHPQPGVDIVDELVLDTIAVPDGGGAVLLDNNANVHLFWGWVAAFNDAIEPPDDAVYTFFGFRDGLLYWNDQTPANQIDTIARTVDQTGDGQIILTGGQPNYGSGLVGFPSAGIGTDGTIYVSYSGTHETLSDAIGSPGNYRHLYIIKSYDDGDTWTDPRDINPNEEFTENVYAYMYPKITGGSIHILYQRDEDAGVSTADNATTPQPVTENEIVYAKIDTLLNVGIEKQIQGISSLDLYPNPASDLLNINFRLEKPDHVRTEIVSLVGQQVVAVERQVNNAAQNRIQLDISKLPAGIYLVTITPRNGEPSTKKLVIE
jgi:hypothetical protein